MDDVGETRLAEEEQDKERASGRESKQSPVPRGKQGQGIYQHCTKIKVYGMVVFFLTSFILE